MCPPAPHSRLSSSRSHCSELQSKTILGQRETPGNGCREQLSGRRIPGEDGPHCCLCSQCSQEERSSRMNNTSSASFPHGSAGEQYVVAAERVFDGTRVLEHHAVAVSGDRIAAVAPADRLRGHGHLIRFTGTLLPGFIDLHAHLLLDQTPQEILLRHGLTTVRDTGGPLVRPSGGDGRLRVLGAGPILTAPGGYPIPVFGRDNIACEVTDVQTARAAVSQHAAGGAALIKVALEPGGSPGAPWTGGHHGHQSSSPTPWPILSFEVVRAIVEEAHAHGLIVSTHLSGPEGARIALEAGVDEWAHVPCDPLPDDLIARA